jgi:hypothetical protein
MSAVGGSISGGPYRIDLTPQSPTFYALGHDPQPATIPAHSPNTLVGDTSTTQIEVELGWAFQRPAETPAVQVPDA